MRARGCIVHDLYKADEAQLHALFAVLPRRQIVRPSSQGTAEVPLPARECCACCAPCFLFRNFFFAVRTLSSPPQLLPASSSPTSLWSSSYSSSMRRCQCACSSCCCSCMAGPARRNQLRTHLNMGGCTNEPRIDHCLLPAACCPLPAACCAWFGGHALGFGATVEGQGPRTWGSGAKDSGLRGSEGYG